MWLEDQDNIFIGMENDLLPMDSKSLQLLKDEDLMDISDNLPTELPNQHLDSSEKDNNSGRMEDWDQDVLLSNAGLPELNPLLDDLDSNVRMEEDFKRMLNDWETQIDSLQVPPQSDDLSTLCDTRSLTEESRKVEGGTTDPFLTDYMSNHGAEPSAKNNQDGDNRKPGEIIDAPSTDRKIVVTGSSGDQSGIASDYLKIHDQCEEPARVPAEKKDQLTNESVKSSSLMDNKSLMGIVISSGPGGHFETYEGMMASTDDHPFGMERDQMTREQIHGVSSSPSEQCFFADPEQGSSSLFCMSQTSLSMSSSQPVDSVVDFPREQITMMNKQEHQGGFVPVIEASDVDNLLEQFEAAEASSPDEVKRRAQIKAAVNNHFSNPTRKCPIGRVPKIVASQRVKDSLPKEVIDKIKSSSRKAKTIAIIEPVKKSKGSVSSGLTNASNNPLKSGGMTSRFQEAGVSLNRNKFLRHMSIGPYKPPSSQQIQVNLDHDYCSSSNKNKRNRNNHTAIRSHINGHVVPHTKRSPTSVPSTVNKSTTVSKSSVIRIPSAPASLSKRIRLNQGQIISIVKTEKQKVANSPSIITSSSPIQNDVINYQLSHDMVKRPDVGTRNNSEIIIHTKPKVTATSVLPFSSKRSGPDLSDDSSSGSSVRSSDPIMINGRRRDSDHKKDSGLESGDVSDASNHDPDDQLYSRLPSYLTTTASLNQPKDPLMYDRLPAYMTGFSRGASPVDDQTLIKTFDEENEDQTEKINLPETISNIKKNFVRKDNLCDGNGHRSKMVSRKRRRSNSTSSSSSSSSSNSSDSEEEVRVKTRSASRRSQGESPDSFKKTKPGRTSSRSNTLSSKKRRPSCSRSSSSSPERYISRSPVPRRRTPRKRSYDRERFTRDRQRREQEQRHLQQEKLRQVEERRVIYVGKIAEGTTRDDLRKRFQVFGPIEEISVHFRDRGDNYGFVAFRYKVDAYEAVEHGNDDPAYPKVDLCFGGRRAFCKEKYSDLDNVGDSEQNGPMDVRKMDFDSLLKQARAGLKK